MGEITWNRDVAALLLRRAGLPGPPEEVDALLSRGLEGAVDFLLDFDSVDNSPMEARLEQLELDLDSRQGILEDWIVRFVHTARPFEERMALFWHMHFATGLGKVKAPILMHRQIQTFRSHGRGRLDDLLLAVSRDPAMLVWLDNIHNHRDAPNENYARELMELFSMGLNTYSQEDVVEAARAFTGWTLRRVPGDVEFVFRADDHDFGTKTFLGETGTFNGDEIIRIICLQEVTPRFIASRMWSHFAGGEPPGSLLDRLAAAYWDSGHSLHAMFRALFTAPEFHENGRERARVKGPVEFTCGLLRQLGAVTDGSRIAPAIAGQGMLLYDAPDPHGWDEGLAWVTTSSLLLRSQVASVLGLARTPALWIDLPGILAAEGVSSPAGAVEHLLLRLDLPDPGAERRSRLESYLVADPGGGADLPFDPSSDETAVKLAGLVHVLATDPTYQVA